MFQLRYSLDHMGIPFFFKCLLDMYPTITMQHCPDTIDGLFIDFNSVIHTSASHIASCNSSTELSELEDMIFQDIEKNTLELIEHFKPKELVYIAIDGVAPLAKISQQRKRRHLSTFRNEIIKTFVSEKTKKDASFSKRCKFNPTWDSNAITPGSDFMNKLSMFLKGSESLAAINVEISDHNEQGEGEHKIISKIKQLSFVDKKYVIHGMDADLIFLALSTLSTMSLMGDIYLYRTATMCVNIRNLASQIEINTGMSVPDFVATCILLGNDFLPSITCLMPRHNMNALRILSNAYDKDDRIMTLEGTRYVLSWNALMRYITRIAAHESEYMCDVIHHFNGSPPSSSKAIIKSNILSGALNTDININYDVYKTIEELEYFIDTCFRHQIPYFMQPTSSMTNWRAHYYTKLFPGFYNTTTIVATIDKICANYLCVFLWNVEYYLNGKFSHATYFPFNYAPTLSDICEYFRKPIWSEIQARMSQHHVMEISPFEQLLMVIPHKSCRVIPDERMREAYTNPASGLTHLYPSSFQLARYFKDFTWEMSPILPPLEVESVRTFVASIDQPSVVSCP